MVDIIFRDVVNAVTAGTTITKNAGGSSWNAGGASQNGFLTDGKVEFKFSQSNLHAMGGLSFRNNDVNYNTISYGITGSADGLIRIYENGTQKGTTHGSYLSTDLFSIERIGTVVYYKQNGSTIYTSLVASIPGKLYFDCSIYSDTAAINSIQITEADDYYTSLLLHFNGDDASTDFIDDSPMVYTISEFGNAQLDTAQKVFGSASGLFDGIGDYLSAVNSGDWSFGIDDFTISFRVRRNGNQDDFSGIIGSGNSGSTGWEFGFGYAAGSSTNKLRLTSNGSGGWAQDLVDTDALSDATWYHVALVRYGNTLSLYVDGVSKASINCAGYIFNSGGLGLTIGKLRPGVDNYYFKGSIDELRISKGIARWTANFTPPTEEYGPDSLTLDVDESLTLSESFTLQVNPDSISIDEAITLSENWNIALSEAELTENENITLTEDWELLTNPQILNVNESISLSELFENVLSYKIFINTDLRWLQTVTSIISTSLSWLKAKIINTDLRWLQTNSHTIATDLRWLPAAYTALTPTDYSDIQILINGVDVGLGNDVDLQSGNITHTTGNTSIASFRLARRHDDLNRTHLGVASQITNQNAVQIYINGNLEFNGYVQNINVDSEGEVVSVTAKMDEPTANRRLVEIPLPSINEQIHLYHCLVNNVQIDNPKEDTRSVIIGSNGWYWTGSAWNFYIENAQTFATDSQAESYIDNYEDDVSLTFTRKSPSVTTREKNVQYFKGIKVNLGKEIRQQVDSYHDLESIFNGKGVIAAKIEDGTFIAKPNYSYYWKVLAKNARTGLYNGDYRYIGTSLASTTTDLWVLNGVVPYYQRIKDNEETELGYYYVGEAPFKEISPKNGRLIPAWKWQDRNDGLYHVLDESYDYVEFAKRVANLEYQKLKTINNLILPSTSANLEVTIDAYYYYKIKLLTKINVTNTTVANTYKNLNGFPLSTKSITINLQNMRVQLGIDNKLAQKDIDAIDAQMPDEDSANYLFPEEAVLISRKFDLKTWKFVS